MMFQAQTPDGDVVPLWVDRVDETTVWVDPNHPLAGVTLHFAVEVVGIGRRPRRRWSTATPTVPTGMVTTTDGRSDCLVLEEAGRVRPPAS